MITREEWDAAYRGLIAEDRRGIGPPPTFDEVEALSRGDLPESDAERVRAALACYPDLLRVLSEPFHPDDAGALTDEQLAADLAKIRERTRGTLPPPVELRERRSSSRTFALAAGIVIAVAIGGIALREMTREPRPVATMVLYSDGVRGGSTRGVPVQAPIQLSTATDYALEPAFSPRRPHREYRLELVDLGSTQPRRVWLREQVARRPDDTYPVKLETDELEPGLYRLVLYGVNGTAEALAEYTLRLSAP